LNVVSSRVQLAFFSAAEMDSFELLKE
jgi:hypothetical protein